MSESKWVVCIDGAEQDEKFDDEESANKFAARRRDTPEQKIAVFQLNTARHQKAFDSGVTKIRPKPESKK